MRKIVLSKLFALVTIFIMGATPCLSQKKGCTDPSAQNFDSLAEQNDGSCIYPSTLMQALERIPLSYNASELNEMSGILKGQTGWYVHNDNPSSIFFNIDQQADSIQLKKRIEVKGLDIVDWEDIAEDSSYFYLGDFGNNADGSRRNLRIYKIAKKYNNAVLLDTLTIEETIYFSYEDQVDFTPLAANKTDFDCEAMFVYGDSIYLFTKQWTSLGTGFYRIATNGANQTAKKIGFIPINGLVTGADISPNGNKIVLVGYSNLLQPFIVSIFGYRQLQIMSACVRKINIDAPFFQCEGICWQNDSVVSVVNERFKNAFIETDPTLQQFNLKFCWEKFDNRHLGLGNFVPMNLRLRISPNPVKENEIIQILVEGANRCIPIREEVFVTNLKGQKLITIQLNSDRLELKNLVPGEYAIGNQRLGFVKITVI